MRYTLVLLCILLAYSCEDKNKPPTCTITNPGDGDEIELGEVMTISASAEDPDGTISGVVFYVDGSLIGEANEVPYDIMWNPKNKEPGTHTISARTSDDLGALASHKITVSMVVNLPLVLTTLVNTQSSSEAIGGGIITNEGGDVVTARGVCWSKDPLPDLDDNHTLDGSGTGDFSSSLSDLTPLTGYYVRAYGTNSFGTGYGPEVEFRTGEREPDPVEDIDGNIYRTVRIGLQVWMAENLRVTHYADGSPIPLVTDPWEWRSLRNNDTDRAYCWYNNDSLSYAQVYGALYTYAAAVNGAPFNGTNDVQGVCPDGWHVPTHHEYGELLDSVSILHPGSEGLALKSISGWFDNGNGTDNYAYTGRPGGLRHYDHGEFLYEGMYGLWWNSDYMFSEIAHYYDLLHWQPRGAVGSATRKSYGHSVRCVRD